MSLPPLANGPDMPKLLIDIILPEIKFDCFKASPTKTIVVLARDKRLLFVAHRNAIALAFEDIAHLTLEWGLAAATMFGFVLTHAVI